MTIVLAVLFIGIVVCVHELGHFVAAKLCGIQVNEFAIFMGPALIKWQGKETKYSIRCIPFGGFCAMEGEDEDSENPRAFTKAAWWKRVIVLLAGVTMNVVLAFLMLLIVFIPAERIATTQITAFEPESLVAQAGDLQVGDRVLEIDGENLYITGDFTTLLQLSGGETHDVLVARNGEEVLLEDISLQTTEFTNEDGTTSVRYGILFGTEAATFGGKLKQAWNLTLYNARIVRISLQMLINGQAGISDLTGPVGMVQQVTEITSESETFLDTLWVILQFAAMLSVNLAILNALPLPALDGGRVLCVLITAVIEGITRKKINPKYEGYIHGVGIVLLLALMAFILFKDVFTIFKG